MNTEQATSDVMDTKANNNESKQRQPKPRFGVVTVSRAKGTGVYDQRGGGRSTKTVECSIPVLAAGIIIDATIYARFAKPGDPVTFAASMPKGVSGMSDNDEDSLLAHIENAAASWNGWPAAQAAAYERLTGIVNKVKPDDAMRPRLVYSPKQGKSANA